MSAVLPRLNPVVAFNSPHKYLCIVSSTTTPTVYVSGPRRFYDLVKDRGSARLYLGEEPMLPIREGVYHVTKAWLSPSCNQGVELLVLLRFYPLEIEHRSSNRL